jgi:CRP-like cAMP-binding protein/Fe-S-cluster-containing hydrogenase component 2/thioredoxin reductase
VTDVFKVAVIGAGPGGMSAAARAAELGVSHVLLEQSEAHANTIQRYQKGKHVMAEPNVLPLRSSLEFDAGVREAILERWDSGLQRHRVNMRTGVEVVAVSGQRPNFEIRLKSGETLRAESVVFAIGVQGNPRRLGVPGDDLPCVQYQLDDPDEYRDEAVVVVGAGDAAIENAIGLTRQNRVSIVNRQDEFVRVKEGNLGAVLKAIDDQRIDCFYKSQVAGVERAPEGSERPFVLVLATSKGEARVPCNRIIARIGAVPPRKFVESCGIKFPSADAASLPELTSRYESNVPGLYIIGALGGYPLIKQAMNQGYEVVEYILGRSVSPADEPLLAEKLECLPFNMSVSSTLALMQERIPLFSGVNALMFRELLLGSTVHAPKQGAVIFRKNDYTNSFFTILAGSVEIEVGEDAHRLSLPQGQFFGEMSLLSGRRRSGTVFAGPGCALIESPRREIMKLMNSVEAVKRVVDQHFVVRAIQTGFAPDASDHELQPVAQRARLVRFKADEALFKEGDEATTLHLIRSGSVAVSRTIGGRDVVTSYVAAGNYVGEMGLIGRTRRNATVRATVPTETISLDAEAFDALMKRNPKLRDQVEATVRKRIAANARMEGESQSGDLISFLMRQGLGEATDVLLIDETLCVGCDNCEKACAETHGGTSRLDRAAGPTFAHVHVPTSCRHCEDPHCMKDCPPDAIRRAQNGEVYIRDNCIGCGNCERNCPYGVIHMAAKPPEKPGLLAWLLFGLGDGPGEAAANGAKKNGSGTPAKKADAPKKAVKCDMCKDLSGGPACVRACPTGAAIRVSPESFVDFVNQAAGQ